MMNLLYFLIVVVVILLVLLMLCIRSHKKMVTLSVFDSVSGVLNSAGFEREADRCIKKYGNQYALVILSVSNLRKISRTFGMDGKHRVLAHVVQILKSNLSNMEPVARINDNMFCFLLRNKQADEIQARLKRIDDEANRFNQNSPNPYRLELRFSVNIPEKEEAIRDMQEKALYLLDDAENEAQYLFYKEELTTSSVQKSLLLEQMETALKSGDFIPYVKPKVRLGDRRITGAEVFARWKHQQHGILTPEMFLPIMEEHHMVHRLNLYLVEMICKKMSAWRKAEWMECLLSINLSMEDFEMDNFFDSCADLCRTYDIPESWLEFELPESLFTENLRKLKKVVDEIHVHGFRCALSNFGHKSIPLHILRYVTIDTIKLDQSLFQLENNDRQNRYLIEAVLKVAAQMHIQTVAEGIDNISQVQYLQQVGCTQVQGHCFFHPMTLDEFEASAYQDGALQYVETELVPEKSVETDEQRSNVILFSYFPEEDRVEFSSLFSPVLEGQLVYNNAQALLRSSNLIHENDKKDFIKLLGQSRKENGWLKNMFRVYTSEGRYEWLELYLHMERNAGGELIIGVLANTVGWKNEVSRWKEQADRDALTGLYNRKYFEYSSSNALKEDTVNTAAIVFLDVDDFKRVNDTLGHIVGDDVLRSVAKKMLGAFRHTDIVARYGGDEFVVFVNGISRQDLEKRLAKLCQIFSYPYRNGDISYKVSGSIGAAMYPEDGTSYQELLDHADTALYTAKSRGKDQFVLYEQGMIPERK